MKYIRTKDNIYERTKVIRIVADGKEASVWHADRDTELIIKVGNTIEELCDEFVLRWKDGTCDTFNYDYTQSFRSVGIDRYNLQLKYKNCDLFGAIWTDKGLIYVAKMNDKGELELL